MKKSHVVFHPDIPFKPVDWGLTKNLVGPERSGSSHIKVNITEYAPAISHKLHMHPTQEEAIFVLEGKGFSETEEGKVAIGPGSVVFVPAGVYHATINGSATEPMRAVIIKSPPGEGEVRAGN